MNRLYFAIRHSFPERSGDAIGNLDYGGTLMTSAYVGLAISITALLAVIALIFKFGSWYGEVNSDRNKFSNFIEEIRKDIKEILSRLPPSPTTSSSPIQLTELGKQISENIDAKSWAEKFAQELFEKTQNMTPFQIQTLSFDHVKSFEPDETLLYKMQESAYESGIDFEGVKNVLGVELRDRLLRLNNFTHSDTKHLTISRVSRYEVKTSHWLSALLYFVPKNLSKGVRRNNRAAVR